MRIGATIAAIAAVLSLLPPSEIATARPTVDRLSPTRSTDRWSGTIDLRSDERTRVVVGSDDIYSAGDVNGDGAPDLLVSKRTWDRIGRVYVVFGLRFPRRLVLKDRSSWRGFRIDGPAHNAQAYETAAAGDVNGDGLDDVIIGAPLARNDNREESGEAYVVFGKKDSDTVELASFQEGSQEEAGFRIAGSGFLSLVGDIVTGMGDLNEDGLDDVAVAAPFAGATYVIFGKTSSTPVYLDAFDRNTHGLAGYRISHPSAYKSDWSSMADVGDVNGDGRVDLLIGACGEYECGSYLLFGKRDPLPVDVSQPLPWGFEVRGWVSGTRLAIEVGEGGDLNGDGLDDFAVHYYGNAYVIFGKTTTTPIDLKRLRGQGYPMWAQNRGLPSLGGQLQVGPAGDIDFDGRPDVVVGADGADFRRVAAGMVLVVYGKANSKPIDLRRLGSHGYRISRGRYADLLGQTVGALPDVTGDDRPEILAVGVIDRGYLIPGR